MARKNKKVILIVEDEASIREMCSLAISAGGFDVITAVNGQDGLKKALDQTPDLILLDILMPVMDGFEMFQKLRQANSYGKKVPVILLTNLSAGDENIIKKVVQTEPVSYIVKSSVKISEIVKKVKEWFNYNNAK